MFIFRILMVAVIAATPLAGVNSYAAGAGVEFSSLQTAGLAVNYEQGLTNPVQNSIPATCPTWEQVASFATEGYAPVELNGGSGLQGAQIFLNQIITQDDLGGGLIIQVDGQQVISATAGITASVWAPPSCSPLARMGDFMLFLPLVRVPVSVAVPPENFCLGGTGSEWVILNGQDLPPNSPCSGGFFVVHYEGTSYPAYQWADVVEMWQGYARTIWYIPPAPSSAIMAE